MKILFDEYGKTALKVFCAFALLAVITAIGTLKPWESKAKVGTEIVYTITDGEATYNGNPQTGNAKIEVSYPTEDYTIIYSDTGDSTQPTFINAGTYAVKFRIEAKGFKTIRDSYTVTINKAIPNYVKPVLATDLVYTGKNQKLIKSATVGTGNEDALPVKGDIISMELGTTAVAGTNDTYRVLKMDGTKAFVVAMYDYNTSTVFNSSSTTTTFSNGSVGQKYAGSTLDTLLNTTFYNAMNDTAKTAIVPQNITQSIATRDKTSSANYDLLNKNTLGTTFYYTINGTVSIGERYVYALDISDLAEYDKNMDNYKLNQTLYNQDIPTTITYPWLRSASIEKNIRCFSVQSDYNYILVDYFAAGNRAVRPAFVIDLSKVDFMIEESNSEVSSFEDTNIKTLTATAFYSIGDNQNYKNEIPKAIDAGTYKVYWKVSETDNYLAYEAYLGEVTIDKGEWDVKVTTNSNSNVLVLTGEELTLNIPKTFALDTTNAINKGSGVLEYKLSSGILWSENIPTATDEGTYEINVRIKEDENHNAYENSYQTVIEQRRVQYVSMYYDYGESAENNSSFVEAQDVINATPQEEKVMTFDGHTANTPSKTRVVATENGVDYLYIFNNVTETYPNSDGNKPAVSENTKVYYVLWTRQEATSTISLSSSISAITTTTWSDQKYLEQYNITSSTTKRYEIPANTKITTISIYNVTQDGGSSKVYGKADGGSWSVITTATNKCGNMSNSFCTGLAYPSTSYNNFKVERSTSNGNTQITIYGKTSTTSTTGYKTGTYNLDLSDYGASNVSKVTIASSSNTDYDISSISSIWTATLDEGKLVLVPTDSSTLTESDVNTLLGSIKWSGSTKPTDVTATIAFK